MKKILILYFIISTVTNYSQTKISNDTLHWNSIRPLTWADFKGEVIEGIGLNGEIFCINMAAFEKKNVFSKTQYIVTAILDRSKSWINSKLKTNNSLTYFQTTFDIYEVHARMLRKEFSIIDFGSNPNSVFQEKYNASITKLMDEFNLFRKETKLGSDLKELKRWKLNVETKLKDLDNYK